MKKFFLALIITAFCFSAGSALAAGKTGAQMKLDMNTVTCQQYLDMFNATSADEQMAATLVLFWLDGYASATSGNHVIDDKTMEADMKDVMEACQAEPNSKLMDLYTE
ncbi:HdeA family protein [Desulfovibrio sp. OttesenSCG-928-M14]|nr:HdeA family protein [Desulfovibrio sp. OttesenSCG-928-M16]MDL2216951.1 HdeA family protein [Desulfovibrio sp. OttesenSCG-928-M14]